MTSRLVLARKQLIRPDPDIAAAVAAHAALADPHTGYATDADLTAHVAAGDPHTGYRLESADHNHQSTGAEAGKIDHGLALNGLADDDHTQYLNLTRHSNVHAYMRGQRITSAQSINDNTLTTVVWNSIDVEDDPDDCFDLNTSTGVITINTAGLYLVIGWGSFDNTAAAYLRQLMNIEVGGSQIAASDWWARNTLGGSNMQVQQLWDFAASDTVTIRVLQDNTSNTAQNFGVGARVTIARLK